MLSSVSNQYHQRARKRFPSLNYREKNSDVPPDLALPITRTFTQYIIDGATEKAWVYMHEDRIMTLDYLVKALGDATSRRVEFVVDHGLRVYDRRWSIRRCITIKVMYETPDEFLANIADDVRLPLRPRFKSLNNNSIHSARSPRL